MDINAEELVVKNSARLTEGDPCVEHVKQWNLDFHREAGGQLKCDEATEFGKMRAVQ